MYFWYWISGPSEVFSFKLMFQFLIEKDRLKCWLENLFFWNIWKVRKQSSELCIWKKQQKLWEASLAEVYSEPCQISRIEHFKTLHLRCLAGYKKPLTIFAKHSILDVWKGFKYASAYDIMIFKKFVWVPASATYDIISFLQANRCTERFQFSHHIATFAVAVTFRFYLVWFFLL